MKNGDFGQALSALKQGGRVARKGWNGKGMWLLLVHPVHNAGPDQPHWDCPAVCEKYSHSLLPWIGMKTADNKFVPWLASQTDMLAADWEIVE